ncbi:TetR/AcrR family transcriptional regulator [Geodermatophilus marinus]|uniref:TetR/AcrR family transcriptional regulator n=1 Tax=Geodermatophilus sp. LHW52908 TaxID=2303986 RepID=UPI0013149FB9|nr:TetR/AcrR family transcriptional regulator [Geodermatophilus sp. LHW52908]
MTAPELERPKRRREVTVERLLDAALETFADVGFAAASVEDVCRRGGFTRGAFYSSFRTKDELFAALYARETHRQLTRVEERLAGVETEPDPVAAAVARCMDAIGGDRTWTLVQAEFALHAARHPEAAAALREHTAALRSRIAAMIDTAAARTGLRLAVPTTQVARTLMALHDGLAVSRAVDGDADDDVERAALLLLLRATLSDTPPGDPA